MQTIAVKRRFPQFKVTTYCEGLTFFEREKSRG